MKSVAIDLRQLHTLDISFCSRVSNAGVVTVLKHCSKLKTLEIGGQQFRENFIDFLHQKQINIFFNKTEKRAESDSMQPSSSVAPSTSSLVSPSYFDGIVLGMTNVPGFSSK